MPPRLSKRQQRELEELQNLAGPSKYVDSSDDDDSANPAPSALGFAALARPAESEDQEDEEEDVVQQVAKKKNKKKKKKDAASVHGADSEARASPRATTAGAQKRSGKKDKGKTASAPKSSKDEGDELDKALAELSVKYPHLQHVAESSKARTNAGGRAFSDRQNALLAVSLAHLDSEAEMKKFFGAKVITASKAESRQRGGGRLPANNLKSNLTRPPPTWGAGPTREGLSIRALTPQEVDDKESRSGIAITEKGERWWTVEYSQKYRGVTKAFLSAVNAGDPGQFHGILRKFPWHADSLLQMSEVYRHQEDHAQSVDYINRALFAYERSFIGAFTFTNGTNRLDFDYVENRPFYLALGRMTAHLQRRGVSRTAFEFARLLLSLDPYADPQGSLLYLDFLAVKAGMHEWLISMWDLHDSMAKADKKDNHDDVWCKFNVTTLPGWAYARALALRAREAAKKEGHDESTAALREAIHAFPSVVPLLADKSDVVLPGFLRSHPAFRVHVDGSGLDECESLLHLLSHLYAHRSFSLWKIPDTAAWLKEVADSTYDSVPMKPDMHPFKARFIRQFSLSLGSQSTLLQSELARSIYRHATLLQDANTSRRLTAFFPRELLNAQTLSCDPFPPLNAVSQYDDRFFEGCEDVFAFRPRTRRERENDVRMLARIIPNPEIRRQLQVVYDAQPNLQRRFPGGVAEFGQLMAQLGDDGWDEVWQMHLMEGGAGREGVMPGGFEVGAPQPETDEDVEEDDNENDDGNNVQEQADIPALPMQVLRNLFNRFWGGGAAAQEEPDINDTVGPAEGAG